MRLAFVEAVGFRGFKDRARFEIPEGFAVLTGRNGVGKSTVFDAIDFALTGTISKFEVKGARGGGLESHIWWAGDGIAEDHYVTVGFVDENGEAFEITRSRAEGLVPTPSELRDRLCAADTLSDKWLETLMQTTLIRDETLSSLSLDLSQQARFEVVRAAIGGLTGPDYSDRIDALSKVAAASKSQQEKRLTEVQQQLGRTLGELTEARSAAQRQPDVARAEAIIQQLAPGVGNDSEAPDRLRRILAERKKSLADLLQALDRARKLAVVMIDFDQDRTKIDRADLAKRVVAAQEELENAASELDTSERLYGAESASNEFVSHFAALLRHGEALGLQDHHCPLCNAVRTDQQFTDALMGARAKLDEQGQRVSRAQSRLVAARAGVQNTSSTLSELQRQLFDIDARLKEVSDQRDSIQATYHHSGITATPLECEAAERQILERQDETASLEQALYILEVSSSHDRVLALEARVEQLRKLLDEETTKLASTERAVDRVRLIKNAAAAVGNEVLTEMFDTVMPLLKELYRRLRPHTDWREIETDFGGKVRATLNFTVGDGKNPQFLFSSGQRRAAGLAFLLAIHLSRPWCRLQSLWLDDPVQHVDDYRALNLVEVLSAIRRSGRQVIVAVEDRALADLLCRRLRSTFEQPGRRFELGVSTNGSTKIVDTTDIVPMARGVLRLAEAS